MGTQTLYEKIKDVVAGMAFSVFLWGIGMTKDQYLDAIVVEYLQLDNDLTGEKNE